MEKTKEVRFVVEYDDYPEQSLDGDWLPQTEEEYAKSPFMSDECQNCAQKLDYKYTSKTSSIITVHKHNGRIRCYVPKAPTDTAFNFFVTQRKGYAIATRYELPFEEYEHTFGDPDRYNVYTVEIQVQCTCCDSWTEPNAPTITVIGGITLYEEYAETGAMSFDEIDNQYVREVASDLLAEWEAAEGTKVTA